MKTVESTQPAAPYVGGKRLLAKTVIHKIDSIKHTTYAEPFVGMGGVFLRRTNKPVSEVINDYSRDVANFFRVLQRHYVAFLDMLRFQITTRTEFERLINTNPDTLTDLERAARFLYLQRTSFGGKVSGRVFGVAADRPGRFDITKLGPILEDLHTRLSGVVIECLHFASFIERYDRAGTLFYIDPPYWGTENYYGKELFSRDEFSDLSDQLSQIQGKFILSLNDVPEVREIFKGFNIESVQTKYLVGSKSTSIAQEVLISNW